jgi:hypothetical protein
MSSPKDIALRLATLSALRDLIDSEVTSVRAEMGPALAAANEAMGQDRVAVSIHDADGDPVKVAAVTLTKESASIEIDPAGFLAWTQENAPDEVVPAVRDSFRRGVLSHLEIAGEDVVDRRTGMVVAFAKPRAASTVPRFMLRFESGGRELVAEAWRSGSLSLGDVARSLAPPVPDPKQVDGQLALAGGGE